MQQKQIDFEDPRGQQRRDGLRGERRRLLKALVIPPCTTLSRPPSAATCNAVLLTLDDLIWHGEAGRATVATIAAELGFRSRSTVQRAISHLVALRIVEKERTGRESVYAIRFERVAELVQEQGQPAAEATAGHHDRGNPPKRRTHQMDAAHSSDGCGALIRWMQRTHQMSAQGHKTTDESSSLKNKYTTTTFASAEAGARGWEAVAAGLERAEVYHRTRRRLLEVLPQRGVAPDEAAAVLAYWEAAGGAWQAGALVDKLRDFRPGDDPTGDWPPPDAAHVAAARAEREAAARRRQRQAERAAADRNRAERQADRAALEEQERRLGAALDALPDVDRRRLARARLPPLQLARYDATWHEPLSSVRVALLEALDTAGETERSPREETAKRG